MVSGDHLPHEMKNWFSPRIKIVEGRGTQFWKDFLSEDMILTDEGPHRHFNTSKIT